jgi:hypothetical protein
MPHTYTVVKLGRQAHSLPLTLYMGPDLTRGAEGAFPRFYSPGRVFPAGKLNSAGIREPGDML